MNVTRESDGQPHQHVKSAMTAELSLFSEHVLVGHFGEVPVALANAFTQIRTQTRRFVIVAGRIVDEPNVCRTSMHIWCISHVLNPPLRRC